MNFRGIFIDIFSKCGIMMADRKTNKSSGCRTFRLRLGKDRALTREPDTVSTVVGKDAYMGYFCIALHLDGFAMRYFCFLEVCKMANKTKRLTESAMLLALAIVLELVSKLIIPEMPFGGQITLVSMLPVVLISYRHGMKWGFVSALAYALLEMVLGAKTVAAAFQPGYFGDGVMLLNAVIMCVLDYLVAFTALGLGGCFRNKVKAPGVSLMCGTLVALGARFAAHIASGYILFAGWAEWFFTQDGFPAWGTWLVENLSPAALGLVYSVVYNAMYMVPEMILTAIMAVLIARIPRIVTKIS